MTTVHPRVQRDIESGNVSHTIHYHRDCSTVIRSPADFADALGYPLARVTKSVFCRSPAGAGYAVLVCSVDRRIDIAQASAQLGSGRLEVASPDELNQITGYPRNGVSPFGLDVSIPVVVSRDLLDYESILVGAGAAGVEIELAPAELVSATNAIVAEISGPR